MKTAKSVNELVQGWKNDSLAKQDIVVRTANECIGWPYVFGGRGENCTPANRKSRYSDDHPTIKTKCQVLSGQKSSCDGCKWHPGGTVLFFDCRGFTYWLFKLINIEIKGAGATSQYNDNNNWDVKGPIAEMPKDKVCCVFRYDSKTKKMEHTLLYDGQGHYIHCSNGVEKCDINKYKATHYAIPKGLYDENPPTPADPSKYATVFADNGNPVKMRDKPSTTCMSWIQLKVGTQVEVLQKDGEWTNIKYNGRVGYMMTKFLQFNEDVSQPLYTVTIKNVTEAQKADLVAKYQDAIVTKQ